MIDRQCPEYIYLAKNIQELAGNKPIILIRNPGNFGDALIRTGIHEFLRYFGIPYIEITPEKVIGGWRRLLSVFRFSNRLMVYVGGGAWCKNYNGAYLRVLKLAPYFRSVLVLPSTYELDLEETIWPNNVIFYARDRFESMQTIPSSIFCHDMAFFIGSIHASPGKGEGIFFRTDIESKNYFETPNNNLDISSHGDANSDVKLFFDTISSFEYVRTDRLHVAIAGVLLERKVTLYEGNYFKNRAVYRSSIEPYFQNSQLGQFEMEAGDRSDMTSQSTSSPQKLINPYQN